MNLLTEAKKHRRLLIGIGVALLLSPLILFGILLLRASRVEFDGVPAVHLLKKHRTPAQLTPKADVLDLLDLIRTENDALTPEWGFYEASLFSPSQEMSRLQIPCSMPPEYDLELVLTRMRGGDALVLGLPFNGRLVVLHIDGLKREKSWLDLAIADDPADNDTAVWGKQLRWNKRTAIRCLVRKGSLTLTLDGKALITWKGDERDLFLRPVWRPTNPSLPFIGSHQSVFRIESMRLTSVTGKAAPSRPS